MSTGDRSALRGSAAISWIRLLILVCTLVANNAIAEEDVLQLEVVNVQAGEGFLEIVLHDSASSYQDAGHIPCRSISVPADRDVMTLRFGGVPSGRYAFIVYQDVNDNDEFDTNFIGYPKEPFGFSNNASIRFGPPGFKKTSFEVTGNQLVRIELR